MAEVAAKLKYARLSVQKCRLVCDLIRGLSAGDALNVLRFSKKKAATLLKKVLESALANADHNVGLDVDDLVVKTVVADQGPSLRRMHARAKGRSSVIHKPTCHITVVLAELE